MKIAVYRTFPYQVGLLAVLWPTLLLLHLHLSGWGTTLYIPIDPTPFRSWAWYNLYNIPLEQCTRAWYFGLSWLQIGSCGYPLTNLMHGFALMLIGGTVNLFSKSLNPWKEAWFTFVFGLLPGILWEKWELLVGITILKPELFDTVQQATIEAMQLLNDTVDDILVGLIFLSLTVIVLVLADRHFGFEYVEFA